MASGVAPHQVITFIRAYNYEPETRTISRNHLAAWIESCVSDGCLMDWNVYIDGKQSGGGGTFDIGGHRLEMPTRSRIRGSNSIGVLVDPKHEAVDLPGGGEPFRIGGGYNTASMRAARPKETGLLIVYPIDPDSRPTGPGSGRTVLFEEQGDKPEAVIGFCLSLPDIGADEATEYVVGRQWG